MFTPVRGFGDGSPKTFKRRSSSKPTYCNYFHLTNDRRLEMEVFIAIGVLARTDDSLRGSYGRAHDELALGCRSLLELIAQEYPRSAVAADKIDIESKRVHALIEDWPSISCNSNTANPPGGPSRSCPRMCSSYALNGTAHP